MNRPARRDHRLFIVGYTILEPGSAWNTMPCHTHERRMEAYVYFDYATEDTRVFHMIPFVADSFRKHSDECIDKFSVHLTSDHHQFPWV
jgi:hypothetical protein